jgi:hypothetical protein
MTIFSTTMNLRFLVVVACVLIIRNNAYSETSQGFPEFTKEQFKNGFTDFHFVIYFRSAIYDVRTLLSFNWLIWLCQTQPFPAGST